jgi:chromosome segregation ATPase
MKDLEERCALPNFAEGAYLISINRLQKAEAESALAHDRTHDLQARLDVSKDLEKTLVQQNARLTSESESIRERIQIADARLTDIQNEGMALSAQSARLVLERDMLLDKFKAADVQIAHTKQEEENCRERLFEHYSHIKC